MLFAPPDQGRRRALVIRPAPVTLTGVKVLLFALGSHGDVHPFVGLGIALRRRGHDVSVAANDYFKPLIDHAGLEFHSVGTVEQYRRLATNPELWNTLRGPQAVFNGTARFLRPMYELATAFAQSHADGVIAASSLAIGARVAQERHGFPMASVHLSPAVFQSAIAPPTFLPFSHLPSWTPPRVHSVVWQVLNRTMDSIVAPQLNALRAELGLRHPVRNVIRDYWHSPQRVIGLFPEWFASKQPDWPVQTVLTGFPLFDEPDMSPISEEVSRFIDAGEPPIAFTPGSAMWRGRRFFDASVDACVRLKRRGLLLTRHRDHLPPRLPPNVIHVHYAPFSRLLPRCAAFVHHAGIGSTAQALAAGVPQLMTPFTHDQPDNSARVVRLGCGAIVTPPEYTGERAARVLRELIESPRVARACRDVTRKFVGVDPLAQTCNLIEELRVVNSGSVQPRMAAVNSAT
jgi:UDP:flavonoid glycosyltransferase YjiC (YdhE family)